MRVEFKLYIPDRLKNRIKMLAIEKGLSMNKLATLLLEDGLYKMLEEEKEYGEIKFKQINSQ